MVKLKLSSFLMKRNPSQQCKVISRKVKRNQNYKRNQNHKRKQEVDAIDSNMCTNNQTIGDNADINKLADELLVYILSRMSLKEAARTSVLAHRWKYLWRSVSGILQFDFRDVAANGELIQVEKFVSWVNTVLELHQGRYIEGMVIMFEGMQDEDEQYEMIRGIACAIDNWVYFAVQKEVERFELCLSPHHMYHFPSIEMLKSHSHGGICSPFRRVRVLRLVRVSIKDESFHYFLASCANLEELYIWYSENIKNLRVVDPPSLRVLEIMGCCDLQNLEISAESLVSLVFDQGCGVLLLNRVPNLLEFTIGEFSFMDFISDPNSSYSDQLVKLVVVVERMVCHRILAGIPDLLPWFSSLKRLEVKHCSVVARSLLFFTSLIKASPQLCEFRIEMSYSAGNYFLDQGDMPIPAIRAEEAAKFNHTSLKVVEMCGYVGSVSEEELLLELLNNCASSIERIVIDTESEYYDDPELAFFISINKERWGGIPLLREQGAVTRAESKERARHFVSSITLPFSRQIQFIVT